MGILAKAVIGLPLAIGVVTSGCTAVAPPPFPPGPGSPVRQVIEVKTHEGGTAAGATLWDSGRNDPTIEARCTASNDRGSWTIAAPGRFEIIPSTAPLKVSCSRDGYGELTMELQCRSPTSWSAGIAARGFAMFPLIGVVVAIPLLAVAMADSPEAKDCVYTPDSILHIWLAPLR